MLSVLPMKLAYLKRGEENYKTNKQKSYINEFHGFILETRS